MFTNMEKQWLSQCIKTQRAALVRSKNKEVAGGEIERLRNKEIEYLNNLQIKVEGITDDEKIQTTSKQTEKRT